jgi:hypothetical protein
MIFHYNLRFFRQSLSTEDKWMKNDQEKRLTSILIICKTTDARLQICLLICMYKCDFMQKTGLPKCGLHGSPCNIRIKSKTFPR